MKSRIAIAASLALLSSVAVPQISLATVFVNSGSDPSGPDVLVYSNDLYTDEDEEDLDITNALLSISKTVSVFDGGDGGRTDWEAALQGIEVLVIPEGTPWQASDTAEGFDAAAKAYVKAWVEAGRTVIGTGSYTHKQMITDWTGVSFNSIATNSVVGGWELEVSRAGLPATVPSGNYTGGIRDYSQLSTQQKGAMEVIYYNSSSDNVAVASFTVGQGFYIYNAYDWYPDAAELIDGTRAAWNQTLQFGATGQITGVSTTAAASTPSAEPARYAGPVFDPAWTSARPGTTAFLQGRRLETIREVRILGTKTPHTIFGENVLSFTVSPELKVGRYDVEIHSDHGKLTLQGGLEVTLPRTYVLTIHSRTGNVSADMLTEASNFGLFFASNVEKVHCLVNSSNGRAIVQAGQICRAVLNSNFSGAEKTISAKTTYDGTGLWARIWVVAD